MAETQATINQWQDEQFPDATREGVTKHLQEELEEFSTALDLPGTSNDILLEQGFEAADVVILIYAWAAKNNITNFQGFIDEKMRINRERKWNIQPDGTGRHQ